MIHRLATHRAERTAERPPRAPLPERLPVRRARLRGALASSHSVRMAAGMLNRRGTLDALLHRDINIHELSPLFPAEAVLIAFEGEVAANLLHPSACRLG